MSQKTVSVEIRLRIASCPPPFCQMIGKDISAQSCFEAQGQEGCFGCAAGTRLCELCGERLVDVPGLGKCSYCLTFELNEEAKGLPAQTVGQVNCQIHKKAIRAEMCQASQGQEGCFKCSMKTRLCEKCKKNPCRIPLYGLCVHCSIEEYGDGWHPLSESVVVSKEVQEKIKSSWQTEEEVPKIQISVQPNQEKISLAESLIPKAAELIRSRGQVSQDLLMAEFQIDTEVAIHLLDFLLEEGIIDSRERRQATQRGVNYDELPIREKIGRLEKMIKVIGNNAEFSGLLQSVIIDLKQWDNFKRVLKKNSPK